MKRNKTCLCQKPVILKHLANETESLRQKVLLMEIEIQSLNQIIKRKDQIINSFIKSIDRAKLLN